MNLPKFIASSFAFCVVFASCVTQHKQMESIYDKHRILIITCAYYIDCSVGDSKQVDVLMALSTGLNRHTTRPGGYIIAVQEPYSRGYRFNAKCLAFVEACLSPSNQL